MATMYIPNQINTYDQLLDFFQCLHLMVLNMKSLVS